MLQIFQIFYFFEVDVKLESETTMRVISYIVYNFMNKENIKANIKFKLPHFHVQKLKLEAERKSPCEYLRVFLIPAIESL